MATDRPTSSKQGRDIEITPQMIEAGVRELSRYRFENGNEEEVAAAVFRAMWQAQVL
jgi:hypothetical protein